ncbi:hypothetical protein DEALK_15160 [Dehalogenimonas alkenigignens]|uniref:Uncharacterized protein n=1 Tax=Dehalogenimonas alkenigignens TaxID=1217799 RepID=A0A0W0GJE9_9CHLR|nr:hypothetical protein [Dehalogenimonas alkenigignens]KTB48669.1 hypothetical protein DEALK_15160 [Dehalogenimonas alkenigignens]
MGKQSAPSPEELEFIYKEFSKGSTDQAVIDEMQENEGFPRRNLRAIRQRRREWEAAKKSLGQRQIQEIDPTILHAREEHANEIRDLLTKWRHVIPEPSPIFAKADFRRVGFNDLPWDLNGVRNVQLFSVLPQHLSDPEFWKKYREFESDYSEFVRSVMQFISDIRSWGEKWPNVQITDRFEDTTLRYLSAKTYDEPHINYCIRGKGLYAQVFIDHDEPWEEIRVLNILSEQGTDFSEKYQAMVGKLENSQLYHRIQELDKKLMNSEEHIKNRIERALLSREYLNNVCEFCPGN